MDEQTVDRLVDISAMLGALPDGMFQATIATAIHAWARLHKEDDVKVALDIAWSMADTKKAMQEIKDFNI